MNQQGRKLQRKKVVSISLGSSGRNASGQILLGDTVIAVERIGTDGDRKKAVYLLQKYDGNVDAIGIGGTDLYLVAGKNRYEFSETRKMLRHVKKTPVLDGSGLKNTLERSLIRRLSRQKEAFFAGKKVLLVCAVDRFGMAEAMEREGCRMTYGDLIYGLGINIPLRSLKTLSACARIIAPIITKFPVSWMYPTGEKQLERESRHPEYFLENDIIAGDFLLIRRFMPDRLDGKTVITNTVTGEDRKMLRQAGVRLLVTTTPRLKDRSFGTNVMEAALVASTGAGHALAPEEYEKLIETYGLESSVEDLQQER